ncbi:MAG: hypothetical protein C3F17_21375 [Bradyrhizobiaceae bacterium]|nr:MAG: hypothetical protein C3F17_21375 [Bradyrhizobiaceae bacterium]
MRVFVWSLTGLLIGLVAGYVLVLAGWLAYAELVELVDPGGGKIMGVLLILAPLGGLVAGLAAAILMGRRAARRNEG